MKKGKILIVGLIALLMAGGLVLAGCKDDSGGGGCVWEEGNICTVDGMDADGHSYSAYCGIESCAVKEGLEGKNLKCNC